MRIPCVSSQEGQVVRLLSPLPHLMLVCCSGLAALNPFASKPSPTPNPVALEAMKPFMKPGKA